MDNQALLDEIERRQLIAELGGSTDSGPTALDQNPAGASAAPAQSGWQSREDRAAQRGGGEGEWHDAPRAALRGMTMGISDAAGSAVAALPNALAKGWSGEGPGFKETYDDIREATQYQEDQYAERSPEMKGLLETGGEVATLAVGLGGPLKGALSRGAARVGGGGAKAARAATKPHITGAEMAARARAAAKPSRVKQALEGAGEGAAIDAVQYIASGDTDPGFTAAGATAGGLFPRALKLATGNPLARLLTSRGAGKLLGAKYKPYVWTASHPVTQKQAKAAAKKTADWLKKRRNR